MTTLHLERDLTTDHLWARFRVVDEHGGLIGSITEFHEVALGVISFYAVHNPTDQPFQAIWRSEGHATPQQALEALADHLAHHR